MGRPRTPVLQLLYTWIPAADRVALDPTTRPTAQPRHLSSPAHPQPGRRAPWPPAPPRCPVRIPRRRRSSARSASGTSGCSPAAAPAARSPACEWGGGGLVGLWRHCWAHQETVPHAANQAVTAAPSTSVRASCAQAIDADVPSRQQRPLVTATSNREAKKALSRAQVEDVDVPPRAAHHKALPAGAH